MAAKIFINYRRDDSIATAGRLHDRLAQAFGRKNVFMDIDNMQVGEDFVDQLTSHVNACDAFLALIGPRWLEATDKKGRRRLDNSNDFVLVEIAVALSRNIPVIPVLLDDAELPGINDLPDKLKPLVRRQAIEIRNVQFGRDAEGLVERLRDALGRGRSKRPIMKWAGMFGLLALLAAAVTVYHMSVTRWSPVSHAYDQEQLRAAIASTSNRDQLLDLLAGNPSDRALIEGRLQALGYLGVSSRRDDKPITYWLKPGASESFKDCAICPEMVLVPSGSFIMGSPPDEPGREVFVLQKDRQNGQAGTESPTIKVTISQPFAVGQFAITRGEFANFVNDTGYKIEEDCTNFETKENKLSWKSPGYSQVDDRDPVVCVSWHDAKAYVAWLSRKTGIAYRLPSEAEREYVTRAGTVTPFWWGRTITPDQANYNGEYPYAGSGSTGQYRKETVRVDSFKPNPWGLYNVHGNVWEWTEDCWNGSHTGNPADGSARTYGACDNRVVRGGSWFSNAESLRAAYRFGAPAASKGSDQRLPIRDASGGFRLARWGRL